MSAKMLDALKELGVADNTLFVFASDNGPSGHIVREVGNREPPTWVTRARSAAN